MLTGITWTHYLATVCVALVIYYCYVWMRYGRRKGTPAAGTKKGSFPGSEMEAIDEGEELYFNDGATVTDELFDQAQDMLERITQVIRVASGSGSKKEDLIGALRSILSRYPQLNIPAFRHGINERILTTCKNTDSAVLTEREVDELW